MAADDPKEIRDAFEHDTAEWRDIREEGRKDVLCVAGKLWEAMDPDGLRDRHTHKRPVIAPDELSQYVNQVNNDIRQNKRAIKITAMPPTGGRRPADQLEAEARLRANLIRQIEYRSNAATDGYAVMFDDAVQRSYGFVRVKAKRVSPYAFDQELLIEAVHNPDLITPDAQSLKPTGADMKRCFVHEVWPMAAYTKQWPKASVKGFTSDYAKEAPGWIRDNEIQLAEYWCVETQQDTLLMLMPDVPKAGIEPVVLLQSEFKAEYPGGLPRGIVVAREEETEIPVVKMQLTNGLDILDETDWPGQYIPIIACYGKVLYLNEGGGTKRHLLSLIRLARNPAMFYAYIRTCETEAIGGVPRATWVGYVGQFKGLEDQWAKANHEPVAYLEARATTEEAGAGPLPLPTRQAWDPPIGNLEIAAESARRAIQSAIGSNFLPTDAQNRNQKSGKALSKIESTSQRGSFHFVDHFEASIAQVGVILNDLLPHYYDTARDVTVRERDDTPTVVRINDATVKESVSLTADGIFDVTISTGPSYDSEREAASDFAEALLNVSPQVFALLGPLIVKLKNLGPYGDEMAELLETIQPPQVRQMKAAKGKGQPDPQAMLRELVATKAELQRVGAAAAELQKAVETDRAKQDASLQKAKIDAIATFRTQVKLQEMKNAAAIQIAEINALAKGAQVHVETAAAHEAQALDAEVGFLQGEMDREHERGMAELGHQQALEQGDQQMSGQMAMQDAAMAGQRELQQDTMASQPPPNAEG